MTSTEDLIETLLRWSFRDVSSAEVVDYAARVVAEAEVAEWVTALACLPPNASTNDIEDILERTGPDIGVPLVPRGNPEAALAAASVMVQRCAAGKLPERDLARWMHTVIGHESSEELELLVGLDDAYDAVDYSSITVESVDAQVRAEVDRLTDLYRQV